MKRRDAIKSLLASGAAAVAADTCLPLAAAEQGGPNTQPRKRTVRFVHFTDTHVYSKRNASQGLARAIRHVHELVDRPDFIINGGDAINDALEESREAADNQWSLWKTAWKEHGALPVRHCLGNHDIWGWSRTKSRTNGDEAGWGKRLALDHLELDRPYYAFDAGGWRFFVLDSMTFDEHTAYRAELDQQQLAWLAGELKATPSRTPVVFVSHIPILTVGTIGFTPELRTHPEATKMLSHVDAYELLALLTSYPNVKLCLSGHTHLSETISFGQVDFVNSGAVCGQWWKGNFHHTSEGYNIVDLFDDGTYASRYVSYGWNVTS